MKNLASFVVVLLWLNQTYAKSQDLQIGERKYFKSDSSFIEISVYPEFPKHFIYRYSTPKGIPIMEQVYLSKKKKVSANQFFIDLRNGYYLKDGYSKQFYPDGKLKETCEYKLDTKSGAIKSYYYHSGHVKAVRELYPADSGRVTTYYYHSGGIQFIVPLISLKVQGEEKQFDQDGKLIMCCQYVANKRNGFLKTYYSSGQSKRIEMYENDKLQNSKCFTVDGRDTSYYPYMDSLRILNPGQLVTFLNKNVDSLNEVHIKLKFDDTGKPYEINTKLESKDSSKERIINDWVSKNLLWKPLKIDGKTIANETDLDLEIPANIDSLHYNILEKNDYQCSKDYWIVHTNYSSRCWVREMPEFRGGINDLMKYLSANIHYPALCTEKGIKGRVILKFVVEKDGSIDNINVLHSAHPLLDKEAIRVVATMPKWKPGTINGKPVSVFFVLPIVFNL